MRSHLFSASAPFQWFPPIRGNLLCVGALACLQVLQYAKVFVVFGNHEFYSVANPEGGGKSNDRSRGADGGGASSAGAVVGAAPASVPPVAFTAGSAAGAAASAASSSSRSTTAASGAPRRCRFPMDDLRQRAAAQLATIPGAEGKVGGCAHTPPPPCPFFCVVHCGTSAAKVVWAVVVLPCGLLF